MKAARLLRSAWLAVALTACNSDRATGSRTATLTSQQRALLVVALNARASELSAGGHDDEAAALTFGAIAISFGAEVAPVTVTSDQASAEEFFVLGFDLDLRNDPDAGDRTLHGIIAFDAGVSQIAYGVGVDAGGDFSSSASTSGGFWSAPAASWKATAGSFAWSRTSAGGDCDGVFPNGFSCRRGAFVGALDITASTPLAIEGNSAEGSRSASFVTSSLPGLVITVDLDLFQPN